MDKSKLGYGYNFQKVIPMILILLVLIIILSDGQTLADDAIENTETSKDTEAVEEINNDFVYREGDKLMLNGEEFRFLGTNNYYFHYKDQEMVGDVIEGAARMGIKVIRIWGFMDGQRNVHDGHIMQVEPGIYDESGFENLDYAIKKAGEEGIKLVIVLTNNWDDFGGMNQYVRWVESAEEHDDFYTNEEIKQIYKDYIKYLINRTNTLTGIQYKDDPTIMTWELANAPRCQSDKSGDTLVEWIREMSAYIKKLDPIHLVAAGDEGFFNRNSSMYGYGGSEGVDWDRIIRIPTIDYGTYHLYPELWGWGDDILNSGLKWIKSHLETAAEVGKTAVLEEYGISKTAPVDRNYIYDIWNNAVYQNGGAGSMFWLLTGIDTGSGADEDGLYPDYDGYRVIEGSELADLLSEYAAMFNTVEDVH
ncbi:MAG: glycoside hydrolase 5 family protein [Halanaerobiales bacterium]